MTCIQRVSHERCLPAHTSPSSLVMSQGHARRHQLGTFLLRHEQRPVVNRKGGRSSDVCPASSFEWPPAKPLSVHLLPYVCATKLQTASELPTQQAGHRNAHLPRKSQSLLLSRCPPAPPRRLGLTTPWLHTGTRCTCLAGAAKGRGAGWRICIDSTRSPPRGRSCRPASTSWCVRLAGLACPSPSQSEPSPVLSACNIGLSSLAVVVFGVTSCL